VKPNSDSNVHLCAGGDHQKGIGAGNFILHFSPDFLPQLFEKTHLMPLSRSRRQKHNIPDC
jgi:hypothetical protein